jgi:hypothetical protein
MRILVITWGSRLPRVFCCIFLCVLFCVVFIYRVCVAHHWGRDLNLIDALLRMAKSVFPIV